MGIKDRIGAYTARSSNRKSNRNLKSETGRKKQGLFNFYFNHKPSEYSNDMSKKYSNTVTGGMQRSRCKSSASMRTKTVLEKYPKLKYQDDITKVIDSMVNGLKKAPQQMSLLNNVHIDNNKSKLLNFVMKRKAFLTTISNDEVKDQNIFKDVYMLKRHKDSYFELLKQRRVEIYYRNVYGKSMKMPTNLNAKLKENKDKS
mmetsp:Transcript_10700/g.9427  ORF Transcript_10700/g.9427 Transcript_10700/m.9427 type:complete len:201 (+) Transcript_10700:457-1059(+)